MNEILIGVKHITAIKFITLILSVLFIYISYYIGKNDGYKAAYKHFLRGEPTK